MSAFEEGLHPRDSAGKFDEKGHTAPDVTLSATDADSARIAALIRRYDSAEQAYAAQGEAGYEDYEDEKLALADEFLDVLVREQPSADRDELIRRFNENARYAVDSIDLDSGEWRDERDYEHFEDAQCELAYDAYVYFAA